MRESGVNAVGFLKGRKKGTEKSHGMSLEEVMPSGDLRNDDYRGSLGRGSAPGKDGLCKGQGPWQTCDCVCPPWLVSMTAAFSLGPFLSFTTAPFPGHVPTLGLVT